MTCHRLAAHTVRIALVGILTGCASGQSGDRLADDPVGNWFQDPFVQISDAVADCPVPRGPFIHHSEMRAEEHARVERGTSCWLAGQCAIANAYFDDGPIAQRLADRLSHMPLTGPTSLWITVKRRFVWIEGCVHDRSGPAALEAIGRADPEVQWVQVRVSTDVAEPAPYATLGAQDVRRPGGH